MTFFTYKDYGITYDERVEYSAGKFLLSYLTKPTVFTYVEELVDNTNGYITQRQIPLFSPYSRVYPMLLNIFNPKFYFERFHLQNLIAGYFLFLFSYLLFYLVYKDGKKAVIAPLLIFLTSFISGHIPANPKDIPFATTLLLGVLAVSFFLNRRTNTSVRILALGIIFGIAQSQMTVGLTLFGSYFLIGFLLSKTHGEILNHLVESVLIFTVSLLTWVTLLPFLGANLTSNFIYLISSASAFKGWDNKIFYLGEFLSKEQRPWHYLFVYLLVKLPLTTIFAFFIGTMFLIRKRLSYSLKHPITLLALIVSLNLLLYLLLHPVIYNGIRHFLYLAVCITLIAAFLLVDVFCNKSFRHRRVFAILLSAYTVFTLIRMVHLHPYEYIYFNELVGGLRGAQNLFETDYWGAAYKEGTKYVTNAVRTNNTKDLKVYACNNAFVVSYYSEFRYAVVNRSQNADIVICDTFIENQRKIYNGAVIHSIKREGVPINNIRAGNKRAGL